MDDNSKNAVGKIEELELIEKKYDGSIVAIGNSEIREKIFKRLMKPVTLVHPTAVVSVSAIIDLGCVIEANAVINCEAKIGSGTFICAGAVVNHNAVVGTFCQADCNSVVSVGVTVPDKTKIASCTVYK